ncbi:asialoglycoprotein receptor 1-like isoform X2 [Alosa pseudoharengus]|uniref:asialoglycoprotein receptor 1-like isoform X2 n=1 Tax=Alosa pseudoharengus TaxID=34774 RepID=UPI003F8959F4
METDEVTYSDITIIKTENANQKGNNSEGANVIYSQVNVLKTVPANDLDPASDSGDFSEPAKHDPSNSSAKSHSEKEITACTSPRSTVLLLSICVLLLAVAVTMGGLYIMKEEKYAGVKEQLDTLRMEHTNVTLALNATQANMSEIMEMLQEQYVNATSMTSFLQGNLTETKRMLADQKNKNDNLTKEITKLTTELQGVRRCADAWEYHDGSCYYFSSDMKNWEDSRDACVTMGGHLAIINSETEMDFLWNKVKGTVYWIGLTQVQPEGSWHWVDNTLLTDPKYWGPNQPDDHKGADPVNGEDCVMITKWEKTWNDLICGKSLKRICESKSCRG